MVSRSPPEGPSSGGSRGGGFPRRGGSSEGRPPPTERRRVSAGGPAQKDPSSLGPRASAWNARGQVATLPST